MLRFLAASLVVIEHLLGNIMSNWPHAAQYSVPAFGAMGVIVFFGISGFIMIETQAASFGSKEQAFNFYTKRILRVLPIYAIATSLQYLNKIHSGPDYNLLNYIKSLAFIPYTDASGLYRPILAQGWTLNYEMFFYLIFAAALSFKKTVGLAISIGFFIALSAMQNSAKENELFFTFYANRILLFFVCGMLVGVVKNHFNFKIEKVIVPLALCSLLILSALALTVRGDGQEYLAFDIAMVAICVFFAASYQPRIISKPILFFERLGDASYSTYLFHGFIIGGLKIISNHIGENQYGQIVVFAAACIVIANLGGYIAFSIIESPLARFFKHNQRISTLIAVKNSKS
ncbi:acyltransferase [Rugamonas sp.]|uniref:acyltransferase family protein n=1 Tax=Rugamonas sp. TaxID=1926287 RepID=UPI0025D6BD7E|nr:acyltransferase [Rugamonas sp.]